MGILLMRLAAPLQSWGAEAKFDWRKTNREPTKSGVIGLLAAALGRRRDDSLEDLNRLRFGVRIDQEGELLHDFHMVRGTKSSYVTTRDYQSDAVYLAGVESSDEEFLKRLEEALHRPAFPLYLGRRACPPTLPLCLGIRDMTLEEALRREPWQAAAWKKKRAAKGIADEDNRGIRLRIVLDAKPNEPENFVEKDIPVSYNPRFRQFGYRRVREEETALLMEKRILQRDRTSHDPMGELEEEDVSDESSFE